MTSYDSPLRARRVDGNETNQLVEKVVQDKYRQERMIRKYTVDDSLRESVSTNLPAGTFS